MFKVATQTGVNQINSLKIIGQIKKFRWKFV